MQGVQPYKPLGVLDIFSENITTKMTNFYRQLKCRIRNHTKNKGHEKIKLHDLLILLVDTWCPAALVSWLPCRGGTAAAWERGASWWPFADSVILYFTLWDLQESNVNKIYITIWYIDWKIKCKMPKSTLHSYFPSKREYFHKWEYRKSSVSKPVFALQHTDDTSHSVQRQVTEQNSFLYLSPRFPPGAPWQAGGTDPMPERVHGNHTEQRNTSPVKCLDMCFFTTGHYKFTKFLCSQRWLMLQPKQIKISVQHL